MTWSWLYLSLRGRLSPKAFGDGFKALAFILNPAVDGAIFA